MKITCYYEDNEPIEKDFDRLGTDKYRQSGKVILSTPEDHVLEVKIIDEFVENEELIRVITEDFHYLYQIDDDFDLVIDYTAIFEYSRLSKDEILFRLILNNLSDIVQIDVGNGEMEDYYLYENPSEHRHEIIHIPTFLKENP